MPYNPIEVRECLRLNAPEWFQRKDFQLWMRGITKYSDKTKSFPPLRPVATWDRGFGIPGEYSDCFMTFDCPTRDGLNWEGSDDDMPEDIYFAIGKILKDHGLASGVIWLTNIDGASVAGGFADPKFRAKVRKGKP